MLVMCVFGIGSTGPHVVAVQLILQPALRSGAASGRVRTAGVLKAIIGGCRRLR
jgi:hypothetical protein